MPDKKGKILFVDDDNFLRKVYDAELTENGYEVILAVDGEEGLAKAKAEDPDLIILDMIMPRKNGFEVLTALQADPQLMAIPVIILSNLGQEGDVKKGLDLGAVDYLVKDNTTLSMIIKKMEQFMHSRSQSKTSRQHTLASVDTKPKAPVEPKPLTTCPKCQADLKQNYKFCPSCGYQLN